MPNYDIKKKNIKIGLFGDSLVGKTSILYALIEFEFDEEYQQRQELKKKNIILKLKKMKN